MRINRNGGDIRTNNICYVSSNKSSQCCLSGVVGVFFQDGSTERSLFLLSDLDHGCFHEILTLYNSGNKTCPCDAACKCASFKSKSVGGYPTGLAIFIIIGLPHVIFTFFLFWTMSKSPVGVLLFSRHIVTYW